MRVAAGTDDTTTSTGGEGRGVEDSGEDGGEDNGSHDCATTSTVGRMAVMFW